MAEVSVTPNATPPEEGPNSTLGPPEVPTPEVATKKPRKPRPPKLVSNLAKVSETSPTAQEAPNEPLPLEYWAGLMQTQKVLMARRKSDRYESFRIT